MSKIGLKKIGNSNELIKNINKIHTTKLGIVRIKRKLALQTDDIVSWCKQKINNSNEIYKKGKNWYVVTNNFIYVDMKKIETSTCGIRFASNTAISLVFVIVK